MQCLDGGNTDITGHKDINFGLSRARNADFPKKNPNPMGSTALGFGSWKDFLEGPFYWLIVIKNSSLFLVCLMRCSINSIASTGFISARYLRKIHMR